MDLHGKIMNIQPPIDGDLTNSHAYRIGHRDARHAAALLVARLPMAVAEQMPGAPGLTIVVFRADEVPAGTAVWADAKHGDAQQGGERR